MTDEIQKTDPKTEAARARMAAARAAKVAKRKPEPAAPLSIDIDGLGIEPAIGNQPAAPAAAARTATRAPARTRPDGRIEVTGHNGEVLSRTRTQVGDIFEIPQNMIPKGWRYQWNAVSISGNSDVLIDQNHMMYQNGWRPVPAERYAGTLVPKGAKGNIIRGQQLLVERPLELCLEAEREEKQKALQLLQDRNESLKLVGVKKALGEGFEMSDKYKGTGGGVRMSIDKSLDVANLERPSYQLDE